MINDRCQDMYVDLCVQMYSIVLGDACSPFFRQSTQQQRAGTKRNSILFVRLSLLSQMTNQSIRLPPRRMTIVRACHASLDLRLTELALVTSGHGGSLLSRTHTGKGHVLVMLFRVAAFQRGHDIGILHAFRRQRRRRTHVLGQVETSALVKRTGRWRGIVLLCKG